jgi:hypothetical protein
LNYVIYDKVTIKKKLLNKLLEEEFGRKKKEKRTKASCDESCDKMH